MASKKLNIKCCKLPVLVFIFFVSLAVTAVSSAFLVFWTYNFYSQPYSFDKPVIAIGSDDWQSTYNKEYFSKLEQALKGISDKYGNHPVFTMYINSAQPAWPQVICNGYSEYIYFNGYGKTPDKTAYIRTLMDQKLVDAQSHSREHWNMPLVIESMQTNAFGYRDCFTESGGITYRGSQNYGEAVSKDKRYKYIYRNLIDLRNGKIKPYSLDEQYKILNESAVMIGDSFGKKPEILVAPGYVADENTIKAAKNAGYKFFVTGWNTIPQVTSDGDFSWINHLITSGDMWHGVYFVKRNINFEPEQGIADKSYVHGVEEDISKLMKFNLPVLMLTHERNYNIAKCDKTIDCLVFLLNDIKREFPDVVFLSDVALCRLVSGEKLSTDPSIGVVRYSGFERLWISLVRAFKFYSKAIWVLIAFVAGLATVLFFTVKFIRYIIRVFVAKKRNNASCTAAGLKQ